MCDRQGGPDKSVAGIINFVGESNTFFRNKSVNQMSPNDGTRQNSTRMTWK
jgi:hypothetical protein